MPSNLISSLVSRMMEIFLFRIAGMLSLVNEVAWMVSLVAQRPNF